MHCSSFLTETVTLRTLSWERNYGSKAEQTCIHRGLFTPQSDCQLISVRLLKSAGIAGRRRQIYSFSIRNALRIRLTKMYYIGLISFISLISVMLLAINHKTISYEITFLLISHHPHPPISYHINFSYAGNPNKISQLDTSSMAVSFPLPYILLTGFYLI